MDIGSFAQRLTPEQRKELVEFAGTNLAYFSQVVNGHRKASADLSKKFVEGSKALFPDEPEKQLTLNGIRPDIWQPEEAA